ncbi:IS200/IS605 family transposase [Candidatus Cardinium hertigii]|uniref:IS200/IS605 family transposase n=1 Tax=Candidatus Cardinium hertigii TaxID=247481 RepID=UPI003D7DE977
MDYYKKTSHTVYDCTYHIVWVTKYRYKVLVGDIGRRVKNLTQEIYKDNGVEILRGKIASNHVHIYISVPPYQSISKVVEYLKGKISRKIQQEFPELRKRYWVRHLWSVGYFVRNSGNVTDQMIKDYIDKHESIEDKLGDFQVEN